MTLLADKQCEACHAGTPRLNQVQIDALLTELPSWQVDNQRLIREWKHPDFASALAHVNQISVIAEAQNHHPDIELAWGRVQATIWTHAVGGLTESDFILAAKFDRLKSASK